MKKYFLNKNKKVIISVLVVAVFFAVSFFIVSGAGFGLRDFGGNITGTINCTCSNNTLVIVNGNTTSGQYIYDSSTEVKTGKGIPAGRIIIGKYSSGGVCKIGEEPYCTTIGNDGTMSWIGTD